MTSFYSFFNKKFSIIQHNFRYSNESPFYPYDVNNILTTVRWKWTSAIKDKLQVARWKRKTHLCIFEKDKINRWTVNNFPSKYYQWWFKTSSTEITTEFPVEGQKWSKTSRCADRIEETGSQTLKQKIAYICVTANDDIITLKLIICNFTNSKATNTAGMHVNYEVSGPIHTTSC